MCFKVSVQLANYFYMLDVYDIPTDDKEEIKEYVMDKFCLKNESQINYISEPEKQ